MKLFFWYLLAAVCGLISVFFVFYTVRLLYVTHGLTAIRSEGQGTYIGAIAFPLLAVLFGLGMWRVVRIIRKEKEREK